MSRTASFRLGTCKLGSEAETVLGLPTHQRKRKEGHSRGMTPHLTRPVS